MRLVIVTGMGALVNTVPFDQANEFKRLLQGLPLAGSVRILLVDAQADVSYGYEDWFKAHVSNKDGLWVGPGVDGQSTISTTYTPGLLPDTAMRTARGYLVDGGTPRLVRLVTTEQPDPEEASQ
mgnify:FL=1